MSTTGTTFTIKLAADTGDAKARIAEFLTQFGGQIEVAKRASAGMGEFASRLGSVRSGMMELGHTARATTDILLMGGNSRMLLAQIPQAVQALSMLGVKLSTVFSVLAPIAAAGGAFALVWHEYASATAKAAEEQQKLLDGLKKIPGAIAEVNALLKSGRLSSASANEYADYLSGKKKLYRSPAGGLTPFGTETTESVNVPVTWAMGPIAPSMAPKIPGGSVQLAEASPSEVQDWVRKQLEGKGGIGDPRIEAIGKLKDLQAKVLADSLSGLAKEEAEIHRKYEQERREIQETLNVAGGLMTPGELKAAQGALDQTKANEATAIQAARFKQAKEQERMADEAFRARQTELTHEAARQEQELDRQVALNAAKGYEWEYEQRTRLLQSMLYEGLIDERDYTAGVEKATAKRIEGIRKEAEELARVTKLHEENAQKQYQIAEAVIANDPYKTEVQKAAELLPILQNQYAAIQSQLPELDKQLNNPALTDADRARLTGQRLDLQGRGSDLSRRINGTNPGVSGEMAMQFTQMMNHWGSMAHQIATTFTSTIGTALSSISENLTDVIMRTKTWGQALAQIGQSILRQVIQSIVEMGVKYVLAHVLIRGAMLATAAISRAIGAEKTAQNIENFTTGAIAGAGESGSQGGWYGVLIYMGVLAAAIAAITAMAGGFASGGFTGAGGRYEPAGIVHRGEYVFSAPAVNRIGLGNLDAMHSGTASTAGGMGGHITQNFAILDNSDRLPNWTRSTKGEQYVIDVVRRNWHRLT